LDLVKVKEAFKGFLMTQDHVKVYSEEDILNSTGNDYFLNFIAKGYDVTQNGDLVILDKPGYIEYQGTGTSHGLMTHMFLLFFTDGILKKSFNKKRSLK
jgi:DNA-binding transcriptional MocR family regulator